MIRNKPKDQDCNSFSGNTSEVGANGLFEYNYYFLLCTTNSNLILDSGVSNHMCYDLAFFDQYTRINSDRNFITVPDGTWIQITHVGNIKLNNTITLKWIICSHNQVQLNFCAEIMSR